MSWGACLSLDRACGLPLIRPSGTFSLKGRRRWGTISPPTGCHPSFRTDDTEGVVTTGLSPQNRSISRLTRPMKRLSPASVWLFMS